MNYEPWMMLIAVVGVVVPIVGIVVAAWAALSSQLRSMKNELREDIGDVRKNIGKVDSKVSKLRRTIAAIKVKVNALWRHWQETPLVPPRPVPPAPIRPVPNEIAEPARVSLSEQVPTGKYGPLAEYLLGITDETIHTMTFEDLDQMVDGLPKKVREAAYSWWWNKGHAQAAAWTAGWSIANVDFVGSNVTFEKIA